MAFYDEYVVGLNQQKVDVVEWCLKGTGNAIVEAVAGSGKTKTIEVACRVLKAKKSKQYIAVVAYNNKIATEFAEKIPPSLAVVKTFHSVGYGTWRRCAPNVKLDENKDKLVFEKMKAAGNEVPKELLKFVSDLTSLSKNQAIGVLTPIRADEQWFDLVVKHDLEKSLANNAGNMPDNVEELIEIGVKLSQDALETSIKMCYDVIDFDDMLYAPLYHNAQFFQNDWVCVDEAQDLNPARRAIAKKMMKPKGGRAVFVGDRHQAIYGFTGADNDSMDIIQKEFNAKEMPLTITYRCPKAVVKFSQQWVSHIHAADEAPEGEVDSMELEDLMAGIKNGTIQLDNKKSILCRNTKPLVETAYSLISVGVPCHVEGKDIGKGLIALAGRWKSVVNARILAEKLIEYRDKQVAKLMSQGREVQAGSIDDKVETLLVIINVLPLKATVADVKAQIDKLFADDAKTLTLSTIHKSKGREWDTVYWLGRNRYQPSPYARQDWQHEQEVNLMYVAATRAKRRLVDVRVPRKVVREDRLGGE